MSLDAARTSVFRPAGGKGSDQNTPPDRAPGYQAIPTPAEAGGSLKAAPPGIFESACATGDGHRSPFVDGSWSFNRASVEAA